MNYAVNYQVKSTACQRQQNKDNFHDIYFNQLECLEQSNILSLQFLLIGSGTGYYPIKKVIQCILHTIRSALNKSEGLKQFLEQNKNCGFMTLGVVRIETVWLGVGCSCSSTMTHVCAVEKLCNKYDNSGLSHFVRKGFCMLKLPKYLFAKRVHSVRVDD